MSLTFTEVFYRLFKKFIIIKIVELYWDIVLDTDRTIAYNKLDITYIHKTNRTYLIEHT